MFVINKRVEVVDDLLNYDNHDGFGRYELYLVPVFLDEHGHYCRVEHLVWHQIGDCQVRVVLFQQPFHLVHVITRVCEECDLLASCNLGINELIDIRGEHGYHCVVEVRNLVQTLVVQRHFVLEGLGSDRSKRVSLKLDMSILVSFDVRKGNVGEFQNFLIRTVVGLKLIGSKYPRTFKDVKRLWVGSTELI